jgi:hypothetical protein
MLVVSTDLGEDNFGSYDCAVGVINEMVMPFLVAHHVYSVEIYRFVVYANRIGWALNFVIL